MLINKIGDIGLLLGMFYLYLITKGFVYVNIHTILTNNLYFSQYDLNFVCVLLIIGVVGKSAQMGLHM